MDKAPDNKSLSKSDIPFPWKSEIADRLTMGDICWYAPGMLNKVGKEGKTSWDSFAYALMMGHNVYCHIAAVQKAQQLMDIESARFNPNWRLSGIEGKKEKEYSEWVPNRILYFKNFLDELFSTNTKKEAFDLIEQALPFIKSLEGARLQGGPAQNNFRVLFKSSEIKKEEIDLANPDDDELRALEESITGELNAS